MPIHVIRDAEMWFGADRITRSLNACALRYGAALKGATVFGDTGRRRLAALPDIALQAEGYWDPTVDDALFGNIGLVDVPMTIGPVDGVEGSVAYLFPAAAADYEFGGALEEVLPFSLAAQGSGGTPLIRGTLMANRTAEIATANGDARQVGAVSATQKLYAALHVLAASAGDTLDVTIESDDGSGFASPTPRLTFAQKTATGSQWAAPIDGAIADDWWRVKWTIGGVSPSFDFVVSIGIS